MHAYTHVDMCVCMSNERMSVGESICVCESRMHVTEQAHNRACMSSSMHAAQA